MQNANYYKDTGFKEQVHYYMVKASIAIMNEAADTDHHVKRVDLANRILRGSFPVESYALGVMTNATIKGNIDAGLSYTGDMEFTVNSLFNAYAGAATEAVE